MGWFDNIGATVVGVVLSPVLVPAAIVAVTYEELTKLKCKECDCNYVEEDGWDENYCSYSCYSEVRDRRERRREQERQRERDKEKERNRRIMKSEIDDFKNLSKKQIKDKYGIGISFTDAKVNLPDNGNSKIAHFKEFSKELEEDNLEIQTLISDLQKDRNAI